MSEKFRIAVLGIGGVGGYYGGKLAARYADANEVEIIFIARGENEKAIRTNGLQIITPEGEQIAKPYLVTNEPDEIGEVDLFILCTKAYDLAESIGKFKNIVGEKTAILPLLNGVNHAETIQKILPEAEIWNGCAFIVSRLISPGVVKVDSTLRLLHFGSSDRSKQKLEKVEQIIKSAGIDGEFVVDIDKAVWEKFIFISSLATATSYLDTNMGGIVNSPDNEKLLVELIGEVTKLARAKKINVDENIEEISLNRVKLAPPESTSSMHSDFLRKGKTELETLTGYVVREAKNFNVETPVYERLYNELRTRN
jgi:2-dehydropantoate 2-reductase